jgi:NAD(P)-dependent dehydrogenase (short-subunit alcohol dehydrogenase family)
MNRVLSGRNAIVTGASQGLGLEIALEYVRAGASVAISARDPAVLEDARRTIAAAAGPEQLIVARAGDVSDPLVVKAIVDEAKAAFGSVHVLVNNAGVYGPKGELETVSWEDWVRCIEINLFGSVLMCRAVLPAMKQQGYGKIIQLSGGGATAPMPRISAYAVSKAAVVRFAESLAGEVADWKIDVNCVAPGALNTRLLDEVLAAGPEAVGARFHAQAIAQKERGGAPLGAGANLSVFLASAASDGITGKLISALWDAWELWPDHLAELGASDAYTLRRITGRDRGFDWGDK